MNNSLFKSLDIKNVFVIDKVFSIADYTEIDLSESNKALKIICS